MQPAAIILPPGPRAQAGKGSFASRPLAAGEVLWRELPLLSLQVGTIREGYNPGMAQVGVIV